MSVKIIEVKLVRGGWKVLETPGVEPIFDVPAGRERGD
jgi:hypothetical protein